MAGGLRIVRLANFVSPASGGLRTALDELGRGYLAAGHEPVLVVPGAEARDEITPQGRVITLPGPELPGSGGYRVLTGRRELRRLLEDLAPDRLEVSDRTTLRWTGEWARRARVPAVMVSHETADGVLRTWGVPPAAATRAADRLNRRSAWAYSRIVCTTRWSEREFVRIGARNVVRAPLGVDLCRCHPHRRDPALRARYARGADVLLLLCSRLSVEKRPGMALEALAVLRAQGMHATLVVAGDGPLRGALRRRAGELRLPVEFLGHVRDRGAVADLQAAADVCLAPGPAETFGLAALEALACGTPVVVSAASALPEVVAGAGVAARDTPDAFAAAVRTLLTRPEPARRAAARARAEHFSWPRSVGAFLAAHDAPAVRPVRRARTSAAVPSPRTGPGVRPPVSADSGPTGRPLRFVALGDSLTAGVGDPAAGGPRGWAALLAPALTPHPVQFHNLATSGALVHDVAADQTPRALTHDPDLAAVIVGVNDTLRSSFDIARITAELDQAFQRLSRQGAVLLTACLPDPGRMLRLPAALARPLARRQRAVNTVVHALAARHDTVHLHLADADWADDRALWSADRLHPNERGHRLVAARFHALLAARGLAWGPAPVRVPDQPPPTRAQTLHWLATAGTAWVARRCRDLLPELLALAVTEAAQRARGAGAHLDARARQQAAAALAALPAPPSLPAVPAQSGPPALSAQPGRPTSPAQQAERGTMGE